MKQLPIHIINEAIKVANQCDYYFKMGAVIFNKNKIINSACNEIRFTNKFHPRYKYKRWETSLHAEQKAILFSNQDVKNCSILVIKLSIGGILTMAKPCEVCIELIKEKKLKDIYYTDRNNSFQYIKVKDI